MQKLKRIITAFIPRIVKVRRERSPEKSLANETHDLIDKAVFWWKYDQYAKVKRFKHLRLFGFTLLKWPYYETIEGNYWKPANDIVQLVKEMQESGIISTLDEYSKIFEPGCNVGRNLYYLQQEFNCEVVGLDISEKAIEIAEQKIWKGRRRYKFCVDNALTTDFFNKLDNNTFDLVITRGHLMHIPLSDAKRKYVETLKRIGRTLVILEPVREGLHEIHLYQDGTYCLSWDDWALEYGLREYRSPTVSSFGGGTRVFFSG